MKHLSVLSEAYRDHKKTNFNLFSANKEILNKIR